MSGYYCSVWCVNPRADCVSRNRGQCLVNSIGKMVLRRCSEWRAGEVEVLGSRAEDGTD
jgi:hypothetical protein